MIAYKIIEANDISIEENDIDAYLSPFLYKYFDEMLDANKKRLVSNWEDDDRIEQYEYAEGFEW